MSKMLCIVLIGLVSTQAQAGVGESLASKVPIVNKVAAERVIPVNTAEAESSALALVPMLTQSLGVTETQATGGMGSIFQAAKGLMSSGDFSSLSKAVPNMNSLLAAAPAVSVPKQGSGNLLSGALDAASQYGANSKVGAQLLSQFKSLGLSPDMISKFAEVAQNYLQKGEMPQTADLLSTALSTLLK